MSLQERVNKIERKLRVLAERHPSIIDIKKTEVDGVLTYYLIKLGRFDFPLANNLSRNIRNSYRKTGIYFEVFQVPENFTA